jgi:DNA polymerase
MEDAIMIAHNARFEMDLWRNCCVNKYDWPKPKVQNIRCTMVKAYVVGFPGSLDNASAAAGLSQRKDQKGKRIMMQLCQPRSVDDDGNPTYYEPDTHPEKFKELYKYCQQDVVVEERLDHRLPNLSAYEKKVWELDQKINDRGVRIDVPAVRVAFSIIELEKERLNEEMKKVSNNEVATVTAHAQISAFLKRRYIETPSVDKTHIAKLLKKVKDPQVLAVLKLRQQGSKSSTAKLKAMLEAVDRPSQRVRGIFQYHAAATGRWGGRKIQPQNLTKPSEFLTPKEIEHIFEVLHD